MSNRPQIRTQRYSRPPSLSTIGSNEEVDFSNSRRNRQTFQSHYSVSPLEEHPADAYYYPQPFAYSEQGLGQHHAEERSAPLYSSAQQRDRSLSGQIHDEFLVGATDEEKGGFDSKLEKPRSAHVKSSFFIVPSMERTETSLSDSSAEYGEEPARKYMKTRYMWMLLQLDQIPWWHNLLAALSAWIVLAAYIVLPGTFTNLNKNSQGFIPNNATATPGQQITNFAHNAENTLSQGVFQHLGLLAVSAILAGVGLLVCTILFMLHWQNYIWLSWKIFQPMTLNAFAGLLTTIINVMTAQDKKWSPTAKINAIVSGFVAAVAGSLFILYNFFLIEGVRKQHRKHFPVDAELVDPMKQHRINKFLPKQRGY